MTQNTPKKYKVTIKQVDKTGWHSAKYEVTVVNQDIILVGTEYAMSKIGARHLAKKIIKKDEKRKKVFEPKIVQEYKL